MATNFFIASTFRASDFSIARKFGTISSESSPQRIWADVEPEFPQFGGVRLHVQLYVAENPDQLADDVDYVPDLPDRDEMTQRFSIKRTACSIGSRRRDQLGTFVPSKILQFFSVRQIFVGEHRRSIKFCDNCGILVPCLFTCLCCGTLLAVWSAGDPVEQEVAHWSACYIVHCTFVHCWLMHRLEAFYVNKKLCCRACFDVLGELWTDLLFVRNSASRFNIPQFHEIAVHI